MKNIAILTGGDSAEHDISILSAKTVLKNLNQKLYKGYIIHLKNGKFNALIEEKKIPVNLENFTIVLNQKIICFDAIFMALHGPPAENGKIQPYFDKLKIPYSSCSSEVSSLTFNKYQCNKKLIKYGFKCAKSFLYKSNEKIDINLIYNKIGTPCFVKPNASGSSYGISKVANKENLYSAIKKGLKYDKKIIIEEFINGMEISVGVFKKFDEIYSLPITEIISENDFFDFDAKYNGKSKEITPANLSLKLNEEIQKITKKIYKKMKLKGICRIDYIIQNKIPYIIEINTIPGLSEESIVPKQLKVDNIELPLFFDLCLNKIVN